MITLEPQVLTAEKAQELLANVGDLANTGDTTSANYMISAIASSLTSSSTADSSGLRDELLVSFVNIHFEISRH